MHTLICQNSGGNDSIATLQFMVLNDLPAKMRVISLYANTGWAADYWEERMHRLAGWCAQRGIEHVELATKGFEQLVLDGDAGTIRFPNGMRKTCTERLKIIPAKKWMEELDPERMAIVALGIRRDESKRRTNTPVFEPASVNHGGRMLWKPLAEYNEEQRDALLESAGWEPLPHRSDECEVCIHANRADLRRVSERGIARVRALEVATDKVMFRPKGYAGAVGIDEVMRWANSERGQFRPAVPMVGATDEEEKIDGCEDDFCGV
jgi:3'-phosphoadenosine 5'-phosphosulfate sulfotransferase (PAPS reductase)/FAD synthetase